MLVHVSDAELDSHALVGDAAVEDEERDVGLEDLGPVQLERGPTALFGSHGVVRRPVFLDAVALGQEEAKAPRLQPGGQTFVEGPIDLPEERGGEIEEHVTSAEGAVEVDGGAYEGEVGQGLGKVAEGLA